MIHAVVLVSAFVILWFLALFCVLPLGLGAGVDPDSGSPLSPRLGLKVLLATAIAIVFWAGFYLLIAWRVVDL